MLARIQRLIVLALLALQAIATLSAVHFQEPALLVGVPLAALGGYALVLAIEFFILRRSYSSSDPSRPRLRELDLAWIGEMWAAPRAFLWRQPFRAEAIADRITTPPARRRGVVFVHGFFCNRGLWNPWLTQLTRKGVPFVAVNLEPVLGSIDDYRETIGEAVRAMRDATSFAPVIVAHSMGGLAVRAWLATEDDASAAHRIVTIATPHAGTRMARRSVATNIGQMQIDSAWLRDLRSRERPSTRAKFICFWSHCDNIVFPTRTATLPDADNRHLPATAHVQMALHPTVFDTVLELVA